MGNMKIKPESITAERFARYTIGRLKNQGCVLACDMGGTYIKSACVTVKGRIAGGLRQTPSRSDGSLEDILASWKEVLSGLMENAAVENLAIAGIGISTPGPFNYACKMSLMRHKFKAIHGLNLEEIIRRKITLPDVPFIFVQDANAFLAGEQAFGAAKGVQNCTGVTVGTGLGFAAMVNGRFLTNGRDSCYTALYRQPWGDGIIEDVVSARGIIAAYKSLSGKDEEVMAKDVGVRAKDGDCTAVEVMRRFGAALGKSIGFHLIHTYSELLVVGGQISKDFPLFEEALNEALRKDGYTGPVKPAMYPEDAALYGVAALQGPVKPNFP
jgi:glucokinase